MRTYQTGNWYCLKQENYLWTRLCYKNGWIQIFNVNGQEHLILIKKPIKIHLSKLYVKYIFLLKQLFLFFAFSVLRQSYGSISLCCSVFMVVNERSLSFNLPLKWLLSKTTFTHLDRKPLCHWSATRVYLWALSYPFHEVCHVNKSSKLTEQVS